MCFCDSRIRTVCCKSQKCIDLCRQLRHPTVKECQWCKQSLIDYEKIKRQNLVFHMSGNYPKKESVSLNQLPHISPDPKQRCESCTIPFEKHAMVNHSFQIEIQKN